MKLTILIILLSSLISCTENDKAFTKDDILSMGIKVDKEFKFVVPPRIGIVLVDCNEYKPKCVIGYKAKAMLIEFNALFYDKSEDALNSARTFDGYYSSNWAFDYVTDEPVLERFVQRAFNAKKVK